MLKLPEIKVGIVAVSRDCFPVTLSKERKERVVKEYGKGLYNCSVVVENEKDVLAALVHKQLDTVQGQIPDADMELLRGIETYVTDLDHQPPFHVVEP